MNREPHTYHLIRPNSRLGLQLRTVPNLQRSTAPAREKVCDLLPCQILLFLEIH